MKKTLIILASIILLFSCIRKRPGDKNITLTFATPTDAITYKNWIKPVIDDFEENHPGFKIKVILTSGGHVSKLQSMIAAGTAPDVFDIWRAVDKIHAGFTQVSIPSAPHKWPRRQRLDSTFGCASVFDRISVGI